MVSEVCGQIKHAELGGHTQNRLHHKMAILQKGFIEKAKQQKGYSTKEKATIFP